MITIYRFKSETWQDEYALTNESTIDLTKTVVPNKVWERLKKAENKLFEARNEIDKYFK